MSTVFRPAHYAQPIGEQPGPPRCPLRGWSRGGAFRRKLLPNPSVGWRGARFCAVDPGQSETPWAGGAFNGDEPQKPGTGMNSNPLIHASLASERQGSSWPMGISIDEALPIRRRDDARRRLFCRGNRITAVGRWVLPNPENGPVSFDSGGLSSLTAVWDAAFAPSKRRG
jgi:hypothetical protein